MNVVLNKDGLLENKNGVVPPFDILSLLPHGVDFGDGVTVRSVLRMFHNYPDISHVFPDSVDMAEYRHAFNDSREYEKCSVVLDYNNTMHWTPYAIVDTIEHKDEKTGMIRMEFVEDDTQETLNDNVYHSISLYNPDDVENRYSLTFTPIADIINLPLKMGNEKIVMVVYKDIKKSENELRYISLYDLIDTFSDELNFFGSEEDKEAEYDHLKELIDDLDDLDK